MAKLARVMLKKNTSTFPFLVMNPPTVTCWYGEVFPLIQMQNSSLCCVQVQIFLEDTGDMRRHNSQAFSVLHRPYRRPYCRLLSPYSRPHRRLLVSYGRSTVGLCAASYSMFAPCVWAVSRGELQSKLIHDDPQLSHYL